MNKPLRYNVQLILCILLLFLGLFLGYFFPSEWHLSLYPDDFLKNGNDIVSYRTFFWENSSSFLAGLFGTFAFFLNWLVRASIRRPIFYFSQGFFLGLVGFSILSVSIQRPKSIYWDLHYTKKSIEGKATKEMKKRLAISQKPILYYFYADWCSTCPDFENFVLGHPSLEKIMQHYVKYKIDLSDRKYIARELEKLSLPLLKKKYLAKIVIPSVVIEYSGLPIKSSPIIYGTNVSISYLRKILLYGIEGSSYRHTRNSNINN